MSLSRPTLKRLVANVVNTSKFLYVTLTLAAVFFTLPHLTDRLLVNTTTSEWIRSLLLVGGIFFAWITAIAYIREARLAKHNLMASIKQRLDKLNLTLTKFEKSINTTMNEMKNDHSKHAYTTLISLQELRIAIYEDTLGSDDDERE